MKYKTNLLLITNNADKRIPLDVVIFNRYPTIAWSGRLLGDKWYGDFVTVTDGLTEEILSEVIDILVEQVKNTRKALIRKNKVMKNEKNN